jgi:hypothetical protein
MKRMMLVVWAVLGVGAVAGCGSADDEAAGLKASGDAGTDANHGPPKPGALGGACDPQAYLAKECAQMLADCVLHNPPNGCFELLTYPGATAAACGAELGVPNTEKTCSFECYNDKTVDACGAMGGHCTCVGTGDAPCGYIDDPYTPLPTDTCIDGECCPAWPDAGLRCRHMCVLAP